MVFKPRIVTRVCPVRLSSCVPFRTHPQYHRLAAPRCRNSFREACRVPLAAPGSSTVFLSASGELSVADPVVPIVGKVVQPEKHQPLGANSTLPPQPGNIHSSSFRAFRGMNLSIAVFSPSLSSSM